MRRTLGWVLATALVVGLALPAYAQVNDDPTVEGTTGLFVVPRANTLEQGSWALGAGYTSYAREAGDTQIKTITVMGGYGLSDRLEIFLSFQPRVSIDRRFTVENELFRVQQMKGMEPLLCCLHINEHPFAVNEEQDGVGDLSAGFKAKFLGDPYEYDGAAIQGWVTFPTSDTDSGIGTGEFNLGGRLIGSLEASEFVGFNGYVGYLYRGEPDAADQTPLVSTVLGAPYTHLPTPWRFFVSDEFQYGFGLHFPTRATLQFLGEVYGVATTEDMHSAYTGGDDYTIVQAGLRATFDNGLALGAAVNRNMTINVRDPDWLENPDAFDDEIRRWGMLALLSYSTSRPTPITFAGTEPRDLPPLNRPPTLECRAERTTVRQGESVRLFATANDPDGDPLTVTWSASAGTITPTTGTEVTWSTRDVPAGSGPIRARVSDNYGGTADCELRVTVEVPPPPAEPTMLNFECTEFRSGSSRIDNRCKAVLDDVALQLRQNPGATAVITGHSDSSGSADRNRELAGERAENARTYLVETHGIDASRLEVRNAGFDEPRADNETQAGRAQNRRIEIVVTIPGQ